MLIVSLTLTGLFENSMSVTIIAAGQASSCFHSVGRQAARQTIDTTFAITLVFYADEDNHAEVEDVLGAS